MYAKLKEIGSFATTAIVVSHWDDSLRGVKLEYKKWKHLTKNVSEQWSWACKSRSHNIFNRIVVRGLRGEKTPRRRKIFSFARRQLPPTYCVHVLRCFLFIIIVSIRGPIRKLHFLRHFPVSNIWFFDSLGRRSWKALKLILSKHSL